MKKLVIVLVLLFALPAFAAGNDVVIAHGDPATPLINGARMVGCTPGRPFLFLIPATGETPLAYSAKNLPDGVKLDPATGVISGAVAKEGNYVVEITVSNKLGEARRKLTIVAGENKLALTPPMGWNSWNVWGLSVSADKVKAAADAMVKSGLAAHGFQYVNIDDGWEKGRAALNVPLSAYFMANRTSSGRDANGKILTNKKFPDMKDLSGYVHSKGLKLGIYSSPGPWTCGGYQGSYQHEKEDAQSYAEWGIDYLKYDWCSYRTIVPSADVDEYKRTYGRMSKELVASSRDIVLSICQYGVKEVWKWGKEAGGSLWRTTGDITDIWGSVSGIGFKQAEISQYTAPGRWNDPDMLVVGRVGWGVMLHNTHLTKAEQVLHISMWSMLAAPLLIGADMSKLDQFTIDLLTNDDILAIDQDPLGKPVTVKVSNDNYEIWTRPLFDQTLAVAFFNKTKEPLEVTANWSDLGVSGKQPVRDLWQRKDVGAFEGSFKTTVPGHGAIVIKVGTPQE
jgi:alpha-galactosidase